MLRLLLVGSVGSAALIAAIAWGVYVGAVRDWDPARAYSGSLEDQRHLAECYRSGCPRVKPSALNACAWLEIIVEETGGQSAADVDAAERVCRELTQSQRAILAAVEDDIRARLHRDRRNPRRG